MEQLNKNKLVIERSFNTDKATLYKLLTEADHLKHWWGPVGMGLEIMSLDVRPGGIFHFKMIAPDGSCMYAIFRFFEVIPNEKLVFTNAFADEQGNTIPTPFDGDWPAEILYSWTLSEANGSTKLHISGEAYQANEAEWHTFTDNFDSMHEGFKATFDKLLNYLITL